MRPSAGWTLRRAGRTAALLFTSSLLVAGQLAAQDAATPCGADEHRQFDFWLGEWEVRNPAGNLVGRNTITSRLDGCALHEHWRGASGSVGESVNAYDRRTGTWHQTWVSAAGMVLRLEGTWRDGSMILEGQLIEDGAYQLQRVTWTPASDGSVRQVWEQSEDGGASWTTAFDGIYRKAGGGD